MFTETMLLQVGRLMFCLLVTAVTHSQSNLKFMFEKTKDTMYCGHLQCWANYSDTDTRVLSIAELSVYDVLQADFKVKLASVSVFDPDLFVEPTKVSVLNVTGSVSRYHSDLDLSLRDVTDCLYGTFTCELDFVNVSGQPDVIIVNLTTQDAGNTGTCPVLESQLTNMVAQIKTHSDSVDAELAHLRLQNTAIAANLGSILDQLSRLEASLNSSPCTLQVTCKRGSSDTSPREKFLLWGTVPTLCDTYTDGGGWVIIQRRTKGDVDFYRDWATYKNGFGTPDTDFWIGNDNIHNLTSQGYSELRIDMRDKDGGQFFAHYSNFSVDDEGSKYQLTVSGTLDQL